MSRDESHDDDDDEYGRFVPLYVLVGGRTSPRTANLDLATQVIALPGSRQLPGPEYEAIISYCWTWISIAEIAAHLRYPLTVTKLLVDVLLERGLLSAGSPVQEKVGDRRLLETILAGLEKL